MLCHHICFRHEFLKVEDDGLSSASEGDYTVTSAAVREIIRKTTELPEGGFKEAVLSYIPIARSQSNDTKQKDENARARLEASRPGDQADGEARLQSKRARENAGDADNSDNPGERKPRAHSQPKRARQDADDANDSANPDERNNPM